MEETAMEYTESSTSVFAEELMSAVNIDTDEESKSDKTDSYSSYDREDN